MRAVLPSNQQRMSRPKPKRPSQPQPAGARDAFTSRYPPRPPAEPPEVVDPRWILKAFAICVFAAAVLGYGAVCLLIWQGSWQLILHPSATVARTPAAVGLAFDPVRFDSGDSGRPRLTGWWIPGREPLTILYLHTGSGSLADSVDALARLHATGASIFAIDYRGFGQSDPPHPTEARMQEDTEAALDYLENTRHISSAAIVPYGAGLGAPLAAGLAAHHADLPAVVIEAPDVTAQSRALNDQRSRLLPMHLLVRDRFDLAPVLTGLKRPKLLLNDSALPEQTRAADTLFHAAPAPKLSVSLPTHASDSAYLDALSRFFDEYLPPADLVPTSP